MKRSGIGRLVLGVLFTLSLAIFLAGCGTAPTAVETPAEPDQVETQGSHDNWW